MQSGNQTVPVSTTGLWTGRILSALVVLFLLFDSGVKVMKLAVAVQGTIQLGYPAEVVFPIGIALLLCTILYVIPRTSVLGATLLTGYLGGATASTVRIQSPWFLFLVGFGALVWLGLYLRENRLRALVPLRS
jgi:hypothetical protein